MVSADGHIPSDPAWCSYCVQEGTPCRDHRGPDGKAQPYTGHDAYAPAPGDRVSAIVGQSFSGPGGTFVCFAYDPRQGYWMRCTSALPGSLYKLDEKRNISERAVGRTFRQQTFKREG